MFYFEFILIQGLYFFTILFFRRLSCQTLFFYMDPRVISSYRHLIGHRRCTGLLNNAKLISTQIYFLCNELHQYYLNVPSGHIYGCILPNTPPPLQKGYENLLMHYHYVTVFYSWVRILTFIWKKTLHFLSSRTYCAKLNKIKIWNARPTDRRRSNSPSEKLRWVTHQSKKNPKTPQ